MKYSIRTLLVVMSFCAITAWLWPRTDMTEVNVMLVVFTMSLVSSYVFAASAWRICQSSVVGSDIKRKAQHREKIALASGLCGIIPYAAMWVMWMLDQFESTHDGVHVVMVAMFYIATVLLLPVILFLVTSLLLYFGYRENLPLLLLRMIGLVVNFVWPIGFYYFILPRLG